MAQIRTPRSSLPFPAGVHAVCGPIALAVRGACTAEDPAHRGAEREVQQGDDHHHDDYEYEHHERVVDQFLAGGGYDLLQFANDLADEECDASEEAGLGGLLRGAALGAACSCFGHLFLTHPRKSDYPALN